MPQTSRVLSRRTIDGTVREIMHLDGITNAYCIHRDDTATTGVRATRKSNQKQLYFVMKSRLDIQNQSPTLRTNSIVSKT